LIEIPAIDRILPHRYPLLLVDRIIEFEPNQRIVGIKHVTYDEPNLAKQRSGLVVIPPTIVMEAVAQVGAVLVLASPANQGRIPYLVGMDRVRNRGVVRVGDTLHIEVTVQKLRETMGRMAGHVKVEGQTIARGVVIFALGPAPVTRSREDLELPRPVK
jgi:3-hydroxyacyl-[acyl-carrier-protein] dehydratase